MNSPDHLGYRVLIVVITLLLLVTFGLAVNTERKLSQIDTALVQTIESVEHIRAEVRAISVRQRALEARYNRHMLGHGIRTLPEGVVRAADD